MMVKFAILFEMPELAHVRVGSRLMVPRGAIEQFVVENTVQPCRGEIPGPSTLPRKREMLLHLLD